MGGNSALGVDVVVLLLLLGSVAAPGPVRMFTSCLVWFLVSSYSLAD